MSKAVLRFLRWEVIFSLWGLYEHPRSHFLLFKFNSTKNPSNDSFTVIFLRYFDGIFCLMQTKIPPPLTVWSSRQGVEKPSIKNCDSRKASSIFVCYTISMSILLPTYFTSDSNLFLMEFMLIWPVITLYGFLFLRYLTSRMP